MRTVARCVRSKRSSARCWAASIADGRCHLLTQRISSTGPFCRGLPSGAEPKLAMGPTDLTQNQIRRQTDRASIPMKLRPAPAIAEHGVHAARAAPSRCESRRFRPRAMPSEHPPRDAPTIRPCTVELKSPSEASPAAVALRRSVRTTSKILRTSQNVQNLLRLFQDDDSLAANIGPTQHGLVRCGGSVGTIHYAPEEGPHPRTADGARCRRTRLRPLRPRRKLRVGAGSIVDAGSAYCRARYGRPRGLSAV